MGNILGLLSSDSRVERRFGASRARVPHLGDGVERGTVGNVEMRIVMRVALVGADADGHVSVGAGAALHNHCAGQLDAGGGLATVDPALGFQKLAQAEGAARRLDVGDPQ